MFYSTADESVPDGAPVPGEIRMITVKTGEDKPLISFKDAKGAWTIIPIAHRGRYLLYQDPEKVQRIMDLETAETWPLLTEALNGVTLDGFDGAWAPDGSYVLFTASARRQERRQWKGLTYDSVVKRMQR